MTIRPLRMVLQNDLSELRRAHAEVGAWLDRCGAGPDVRFDAKLVVEEIITNLIKYAWSDGSEHRIVLGLDEDDGRLVLRFEDDGRPFDPRTAPEPPLAATLEGQEPRGLGLRLVRRVAERVDYHREAGVNRLAVRLRGPRTTRG